MADDIIADEQAISAPDWPLRPWALAGLLGLAGLLIHLVTHDHEQVGWRVAVAAFLLFGSLAAAFTVERDRWKEPAAFALVIGLVMAGLAWRAVSYGQYLADEQYGFASGCVATALALPLFQAGFLRSRSARRTRQSITIFGPTRSAPPERSPSPACRGRCWRSSRSCSCCSRSTFCGT